MSKLFIGTGKIILLVALVAAFASQKKDRGVVQYRPDCESEYVETLMINEDTNSVPRSLKSTNGCEYRIRLRDKDLRYVYWALEKEQRRTFFVKGRFDGGVLEVNDIFHRDNLNNKIVSLIVSPAQMQGRCLADTWNTYCFKSPIYIQDVIMIEAVVDTSNTILDFKEVKRF